MSTITKEFTKEQLIEKLQHRIAVAAKYPDLEEAQIDAAILKIALASLEAEPYGYVHKAAYETAGSCGLSNDHEAYRDSSTHIAVYTAPPAPESVPDGVLKSLLPDAEKSEFWFEHDGKILFEGVKFNNAVFDACRAAMLKHSEPFIVTSDHRMMEMPQVEAINAVTAMLQGAEPITTAYKLGSSPEIPDGWKLVPVDMTPEQMRAVQLKSDLGSYAAANLSGAYALFHEFWGVAVESAPQQE